MMEIMSSVLFAESLCLYSGLPEECLPVLERCLRDTHIDVMPDQLTVNQYESGQGEVLSDFIPQETQHIIHC